MEEIIKVDLNRYEDRIFAEIQQGERDTRILYVEPRIKGESFPIPAEVKAKIQYDKPDGKTVTKGVEIRDNRVVIPFHEQMCTTEGVCSCKITFYTDTQFDEEGNITQGITVLKSTLFKVRVRGGMIDEAHIVSSDEFSDLLVALQRCDKVVEDFRLLNIEFREIADDAIQATKDLRKLEEDLNAEEALRVAAENNRVSAEEARDAAENLRAQSEETRNNQESERQDAETARTEAENARAAAEAAREQAEAKRQSDTEAVIKRANEAAQAADGNIGNLNDLDTTSKENLVSAINELKNAVHPIPSIAIAISDWQDNQFTLASEWIHPETICDIYFANQSIEAATIAGLSGETQEGQLVLTAAYTPEEDLSVDVIKVVNL